MAAVVNSVRLYRNMNLKTPKLVTSAARPSLTNVDKQPSCTCLMEKEGERQGERKRGRERERERDLMILGIQLMLAILEVKGLAMLASVSDRDTPACAALRA